MKTLDRLITLFTLMTMVYVGWRLTPHPKPEVAPKAVTLTGLENEPAIGAANAPYTIVLFSDYSCPYCKKAEAGVVVKIKELAAKGKVRYIFQDFPLPMHKDAAAQAQAGRCAWQISPAAFLETQTALFTDPKFTVPTAVEDCVSAGSQKPSVEASIARGKAIGIAGTPSFVVGKTIPGGVKGSLYVGDPELMLKQIE